MSKTKYFASFFFFVIIFMPDFSYNVDGGPLPKPVLNSTRKAYRNATRIHGPEKLTTMPIIQNPRFFGKFSFLAGLGLPETASPTITRNDILLDDQATSQYSVSYNFPPRRWGPYVAAVYEPLPILSFFQNPWAYLTAAFNPFNWFTSSNSGTSSVNRPSKPANLIVESITPDKNQDNDLLVLVQDPDNEISNGDRNTLVDKIELKMEEENFNDARLQDTVNTKASTSLIKRNDVSKDYVTIANDIKNMDLIADETTVKLFEEVKMDDEQDNVRAKGTTHKMKKHNVTTTATTTITTTKMMSDSSSSVDATTTETITTMINSDNTLNAADQSSMSQKNSTSSNNGNTYYYHGYPQNISNIEFTSQATTTNAFIPIRYHNFNEFLQYPTSYYNSYGSQSQAPYDHYNLYEQKPPKVNDYYSRNIEFLPNSGNSYVLNGFKPSFPFHL